MTQHALLRPISRSFGLSVVLAASAARATDYYVSPSGDDRNVGTSATAPWRTFVNVNARSFVAGDRVLLEGSQSFSGGLTFDAMDRGTAASPVTVSTYGTGRATLRPTTGNGLYAYNVAGLAISNLVIVGPGAATSTQSGINLYADLAVATRLLRQPRRPAGQPAHRQRGEPRRG